MNPFISLAKAVLPNSVVRALRARYRRRTRPETAAQQRVPMPHAALTDVAGSFAEAKATATTIEGMLSDFSMGAMDSLLAVQQVMGTAGHVLEFGVYKGRSAALLAYRVQQSERFILVDVAEYLNKDKIRSIVPSMEFFQCSSEDFREEFPDYNSLKGNCRFIHIDSSHAYRTTINELSICEELLAVGGIAVLDDFTNLNYSQILAATYKYLYTTKTDLMVFMVTDEKAYLCRKGDFERFGRFVLEGVLPSMAARGLTDVAISRTDWDEEYRAIYLRYRLPGETEPYYGEKIYGQFYHDP